MLPAVVPGSQIQMLSFVSLDTTDARPAEGIVKRRRTVRRMVTSVVAMLGVAMIPTSLFALSSDPNGKAVAIPGAAVAVRPTPAEQRLHRSLSGEPVRLGGPPPQRAASRDSLRNGAVIGAVIGAAAVGAFGATLCHQYRERGGASCVPDAIRFAAIGGAIGLGAGIAIDVARDSSPMVRLTIAF